MYKLLTSVIGLACLIVVSQSLVIRRRSIQDTPHPLTQAFHALERQKRHIARTYGEYDNQFSPYNVYLGSNYKRTYEPSLDFAAPDFEYYPAINEELYGTETVNPNFRKDHKRSKSVPSREELEAIFGSLNRASDRTKKRQISENKQPPRENSVPESDKPGMISKSKLQEMLSEAEKDPQVPKQKTRVPEHSVEKKSVEKSELDNIFENKESKDKREAESSSEIEKSSNGASLESSKALTKEKQNSPPLGTSTQSERAWELYRNMDKVSGVKKKRSGKQAYSAETAMSQALLDLTRKVAQLEDDNARLRLIQALGDKENDLLSSALKDATLAQLQGTDQYLQGEYGDIENAIRVEEVLQDLKSNNANQDTPKEDDVDDDTAEDSSTFPTVADQQDREPSVPDEVEPFDDTMGRWYDEPVDISVQNNNDEESQKVLESYLQNYINNNQNELAASPSFTEDDRESIDVENPTDDIVEDMDTCPEIAELSTNCELATINGLEVDDEARNLCIRHEICYSCGGTLSMSKGQCDNGYRGDVIGMCNGQHNCIRSGAKFLMLMKEGHSYEPRLNSICDSVCVKDFIVGV